MTPIAEQERSAPDDEIVAAVVGLLDDGPAPNDAAGFEHLTAALLIVMEQPDVAPRVPFAAVEAIEKRRDRAAAGLLGGLGVLAAEPVARCAREAVGRLAATGVSSPVAERLGTLTVDEVVRADGGEVQLLIVLLKRPAARKRQVAMFVIEHSETGGALVDCAITPPVPAPEAREMMAAPDAGEGGPEALQIGADELIERVTTAAQRSVDEGIALGSDAAPALPILARALTGDPSGLPRPQVVPPWGEDDPDLIVDAAEDEDGFQAVTELLLEEFEQYAKAGGPPGEAVSRQGGFVASTMLDYKGGYADGVLGRWTEDDVEQCLLGHFPRKVSMPDDELYDIPECAIEFLRFLDDRGSLSGAPVESLENLCFELAAELVERGRDPSNWGLAKSMAMQMFAEGVDIDDPAAVGSWIERFNERPRAERDAVIGGASDRMFEAAGFDQPRGPRGDGGSQRRAAPRRRAQRKSQKASRRHNRGS